MTEFKPGALFVGDLHIHERSEFPAEIGKNPRLLDGLHILDQIIELVKIHKLKSVIFTGDLFELKDKIPNHQLVPFAHRMSWIKDNGAEIFALRGNHDFKIPEYATTGIFPDIIFIDDTITLFIRDGETARRVGFIPFFRKFEEFQEKWQNYHNAKEAPDIIVFHNELPGVYYHKKKMSEKPNLEFTTFPIEDTKYIGGHIHMPQLLKSKNNHIEFIGTPYPIDFSDVPSDWQNYVLLYDLHTNQFEPVFLNYPKFLEIDLDSKDNPNLLKAKDNYLRIVGIVEPKEKIRVRELKRSLLERGAKGVQIKVKYLTEQVARIKAEKTDHRGVISQYLRDVTTSLDKDRLLKTGLDLLEKVK